MGMFGTENDWELDPPPRYFSLEDYEGGAARWCPGCGDFGVLTAVQRICRDEQLEPEQIVAVSGIGCSSRFPHYMDTYGFHGLHGRPLPVACGIKSRRPDLKVWVATGDGDCCSIGAGHWIHAIRYNMDITVMLFDNNVYGLTKNQTSPTSPQGMKTNTHPRGAWLPPLNPLRAVLGFTNCSFVAQVVDWNPALLYETLRAAYHHRGTSFVRILQRCPAFSGQVFEHLQHDPASLLLLQHEDGMQLDPKVAKLFPNSTTHDPSDMKAAREIADSDGEGKVPVGVLYRDPNSAVYDDFTNLGMEMGLDEKIKALDTELDRFAI